MQNNIEQLLSSIIVENKQLKVDSETFLPYVELTITYPIEDMTVAKSLGYITDELKIKMFDKIFNS